MSIRLGRQTPTREVVLPYNETHGQDAIDLYNSTGRTCQEWQEIQLNNILAVNDDGLWTHAKYGYSVPRRNGKNEIVSMREFYGLTHGERMLHTAHRTTTSSSAAKRLAELLDDAGYEEVIRMKKDETYNKHYTFSKQFGLEKITLLTKNGGQCCFRTRTSKGGLGEGFDLLVIDEAQEYLDDQESSLKYVVSDSMNPQTIYCGTPPTAVSSGTKFLKYRRDCTDGKLEDAGWAEWSVDDETDARDVEAWYQTNPSLGTILTERKIRAEIGEDLVDFNIQRLGLWYKQDLKSAISENEWNALRNDNADFKDHRLFVGVKFGKDGTNVSMSIATKTTEGKVFVECIDCKPIREGIAWICDWLAQSQSVVKVAIDGANGQSMLVQAMKDAKLKPPVLPTVKEIITANAIFEQGIFNERICHSGQDALKEVVGHCEKRNIGSNGGFGYQALTSDLEIALMDSCILAHWLCANDKGVVKQRVRD